MTEMFGRKAAFWLAVGGVAILAQFTLELAARRVPFPGLQRFAAFVHSGGDTSGS